MDLYLKGCAAALIGVVLCLCLGKQSKEMGMILALAICCMICTAAVSYLKPVVEFMNTLEQMGGLSRDLVTILLKASGIGLISELACLICADAGNSALGKTLQILGSAVILWLSIPLFQALLELMQQILGDV